MFERMSLARYRKEILLEQPKPDVPKYRNKKVTIDGITFDSIIEGAYYLQLKAEIAAGVVGYFLCQVPLRVLGQVVLWVDFQVFPLVGREYYVDVKGKQTQVFKNKKKQVEATYPIEVKLVYRKDIPANFITAATAMA